MRFALAKYISKGKIPTLAVAALLSAAVIGSTALYAADAIQLRWEFEETTGSAVTDSSGPNTATLYNNPARVAGYTGSAISLDGVNQYVQSNTPIESLGVSDLPYALSAWVQVPAGVQDGNIIHISSQLNGGGWCIPFLRLQNGVFQATGWDGNSVSAIGTTAVQPNQWYQVLTSWDPDNGLRLFVNGVLEDSSPQANFDAYNAPVYTSVGLGNNTCSENQGYLRGIVDDVRVYDRVIQAEDIADVNNPVPAADVDAGDDGSGTPGADGAVGDGVVSGTPLAPNTGIAPRAALSGWAVGAVVTGIVVILSVTLQYGIVRNRK